MHNTIHIHAIPQGNFEGYYWYSNNPEPEIQRSGSIDVSIFKDLPFVIEANFFDKNQKISVSVRHFEGQYHIVRYDLAQIEDGIILDDVTYEGHKLEGQNYLMKEAWLPIADPLLAGMKTLQPAWAAFAGFIDPQSKS